MAVYSRVFTRCTAILRHANCVGTQLCTWEKNVMNMTATLPNFPSPVVSNSPVAHVSRWRLRYLSFIAAGLVIMGILCNVIFYSEFGQGFSSLVYAVIGLLLDLTKIAIIGLFVIFVADFEKNIIEVTICAVVWFILSLLSFGAAYGFLSQVNEKYEADRLKQSNIYAQHENAVKMAQNQLDGLAQYASVNPQSLEAQRSALQASLAQWEEKKANCPKNWYTKCINPARAKINDIQAKLLPIGAQLDGHAAYQAAVQHKQIAVEAFSKLDGSAAVQYHPLFVNVGDLTNSEPRSVKSIFILLTSFVVELLASVLFFLKAQLVSLSYVYTQPSFSPRTVNADADLQPAQPVQPPVQSMQSGQSMAVQSSSAVADQSVSTVSPPPNTAVYQQIVADIRSGKLRSGSFRTLKARYKLNQNEIAAIRNQLVADGLAVMNRRELIFV